MRQNEINQIQLEILHLVAQHNGVWSWYQLDRALSYGNNLSKLYQLIPMIKDLMARGFLWASGDDAMPHYRLTPQGYAVLNSLTSKTSSLESAS